MSHLPINHLGLLKLQDRAEQRLKGLFRGIIFGDDRPDLFLVMSCLLRF